MISFIVHYFGDKGGWSCSGDLILFLAMIDMVIAAAFCFTTYFVVKMLTT